MGAGVVVGVDVVVALYVERGAGLLIGKGGEGDVKCSERKEEVGLAAGCGEVEAKLEGRSWAGGPPLPWPRTRLQSWL